MQKQGRLWKHMRKLAAAMAISLAAMEFGGALLGGGVGCAYAAEAAALSQTEKSMIVGDTFQLKVTGVEDSKATYSWSSSATSVATVNSRGIVTGVSLGSTVIKCKVTRSDKTSVTLSCNVTVRTRIAATDVSISNGNYRIPNAHVMGVGDTYNFRAELLPANTTDRLYWEIVDSSYAIVSADGVVAALKPGITRLIVYAGKDEASAKAEANQVVDELYIYVAGDAATSLLTPIPTPTTPPLIYESTPTPTPYVIGTVTPSPTAAPAVSGGTAEVEKVTLVSADTLQITFGKPVMQSDVLNGTGLTSYISVAASSTAASYGTLSGALSEDKRTLTLTASGRFDGTYVVMVASGIRTLDGNVISRFVQTLNLKDTTGPVYTGTIVDSRGYLNTIQFNEKIDISNLSLVAVASSCTSQTSETLLDLSNYTLSEDGTAILMTLDGISYSDENKELTVGINGITDLCGNRTSPSILTVTLKADTALRAPGQIVSVKRTGTYEVQVVFDSPLYDAGAIIVGGKKIVGTVSSDDECIGVYYLDSTVMGLTGNQVVGVTGWYSYYAYGSVYNTLNYVVDFSVPTTPPTLTSMRLVTTSEASVTKLILEYDREVQLSRGTSVLSVSYRSTGGDITPKSVTYIGSADQGTVTLEIYSGQMSGNGTYTITLPSGFVKDYFDKSSVGRTFSISLEAAAGEGKLAAPTSVEQDAENASVIYVKFATRVDETTATTLTNYVLANYANPVKAELVEQGAGGATVRLTFAEGVIPYDSDYPIKISGVRGYNNSYTTMNVFETELTLVENVAPIYASAYFASNNEIVLTFFESTALAGTPDFSVYYNGKNIAWFSYISSGNTVRIYLNEDVKNGSVTVMPTGACQISDTSGNMATLSGSYTVRR